MTSLPSKYFGPEWRCQVSTVARREFWEVFLEPGSGQGLPQKGCSCFIWEFASKQQFLEPYPSSGLQSQWTGKCSFTLFLHSGLSELQACSGDHFFPGPHLGISSFQWWQEPRLAGTIDTAIYRRAESPRNQEQVGWGRTRPWSTQAARPKLSPAQLHGAQRTTLATYRLVCGESHLHGKSRSNSYLSDAERWVLRIIGEFQPSRLNQTWACTLHFTAITEVWQKGKGFFPLAGYEVDFIWLACVQMLSLLLTSCVTVDKLLCFSVPQLPSL